MSAQEIQVIVPPEVQKQLYVWLASQGLELTPVLPVDWELPTFAIDPS